MVKFLTLQIDMYNFQIDNESNNSHSHYPIQRKVCLFSKNYSIQLEGGMKYRLYTKVVLRIGFAADSWVVRVKPRNLSIKVLYSRL